MSELQESPHPSMPENLKPSATETPTNSSAKPIDDLDLIVEQLLETELLHLRQQALDPDKAVAARLVMALIRPTYKWFLLEERALTDPEAILNAVGQFMGNLALLTAARATEADPMARAQALKFLFDSAMATIGGRGKPKSSIIMP